jgi:hypothetical protein
MHSESKRRNTTLYVRRSIVLLATGLLTLTAACSSDHGAAGSTVAPTASVPGSAAATGDGSGLPGASDASDASIQPDIDPCSLLTVAEIEAAIGPGVERGGFGDDLPGRCTYSIRGDVGAGVVGISIDQPYLCGPLLQALDADSLDPANAVRVDIGDGGVLEQHAGSVQFAIGQGCVGIVGSNSGQPLGQDALVALATSAAGRLG